MKTILPLPNLDDLTYQDLVKEAQTLIPSLCPEWTDHNPSDPGMTLVELLAWLTEMASYRLNQVPEENYRTFIKLLRGSKAQQIHEEELDDAVRQTVRGLWERYRAVTCEDYEHLVIRKWPQTTIRELLQLFFDSEDPVAQVLEKAGIDESIPFQIMDEQQRASLGRQIQSLESKHKINKILAMRFGLTRQAVTEFITTAHFEIKRASCIPQRNLTNSPGKDLNPALEPGQMSVVVVPGQRDEQPLSAVAQHAALWEFLDKRRLLATRHHVVGPIYVPGEISISGEIVLEKDAAKDTVLKLAEETVRDFIDPLVGGRDRQGWPFGKNIYVSEIYDRLAKVAGVYYTDNLTLATGETERMLYTGNRHPKTLVGIKLYGNELINPKYVTVNLRARYG